MITNQLIAHLRKVDRKPQSLRDHLKEVSEFAERLIKKVGLEKVGKIVGALHDLGKASEEFQSYIGSAEGLIDPDEDDFVDVSGMKGKIDHSSAGAQTVYRNLSNISKEGSIAAQILSLCIASHHSGMIDCISPDGQDNFKRRIEKPEEKTHTSEALLKLELTDQEKLQEMCSPELVQLLIGKLKSLDEKNDSKQTRMFKYGLLVRYIFSCLIDADRLSTADFEFPKAAILRNQGKYTKWNILINRLDARLKRFETKNQIDEIRQKVSQQCLEYSNMARGLYQLTVPTGGGKTLASLRFALHHAKEHGMDRVVYVIPYTTIIDQNADEVRSFLEEKDENGRYLDKVVLEHHSNLTPDEESKRQNLLSENWDAPIVFTTSVQFLEALFSGGTRSARRMHQLANAVIIFDEVQTIPLRCVHMFNIAIRFLVKGCGSTVVLCTATQPLLDKIEIKERALEILPKQRMIQDVSRLFKDLKRAEVHDCRKVGGWSEEEVARLAREQVNENGSVLVVVNTKQAAKDLFQRITVRKKKGVYHLSADMCPAHRMDVLRTIKDRLGKKPTICVSTQLIEAGVDIDFGSVIRYLAGLDSIAQAAGRCNRHGARKSGNVFIVNPRDENLSRLRDIKIGVETAERVLDEFKNNPEQFDGDILSPKLMERFYQYYFYDRKDEMKYPVSSKSPIGREDNLFELLSTNRQSVQEYERIHQSSPALFLRQSFQSASKAFRAIDSPTQGIIVPYGKEGKQTISDLCGAFEVEKQHSLLKRAQRFSVNVYENVLRNLAESKAIHEIQEGSGILYLRDEYYCNEFGLSKEIVNEMEPLVV